MSGLADNTMPHIIISPHSSPNANKSESTGIVARSSLVESDIPLAELPHEGTGMTEDDNIEAINLERRNNSKDRKGKGRATAVDDNNDEQGDRGPNSVGRRTRIVDDLENYELVEQGEQLGFIDEDDIGASYPPVGDDEIEERRVNETLKRWEEQERQRRRALRDSNRTSMSKTSLVEDVSRRASKLWNESSQGRTSFRRGATRIRDMESSFEDSSSRRTSEGTTQTHGGALAPATPSRRDTGRSASPSSPTPLVSNNPFNTPRVGSPASFQLEDRPSSANERDVFIEESSNPPTPSNVSQVDPEFPDRPVLQASNSYPLDTLGKAGDDKKKSTINPPPPRPLDLPVGVAPLKQMERTSSPVVIPRSEAELADDDEIEAREREQGRWWTDWLCGCRENSQEQGGKTNPFE